MSLFGFPDLSAEPETLESLVAQFCSPGGASEAASAAANAVVVRLATSGSFLDLVQAAGPQLTAPAAPVRKRAVDLLGTVLRALPTLALTESELGFVLEFFTDRLQDGPSMSESLAALVALVSNHRALETSALVRLMLRVGLELGEGAARSLSQPTRLALYTLYALVLAEHPAVASAPDFAAGGSLFVSNFIAAMDGEKDPRNLTCVFQVVRALLAQLPGASALADELFDVTSCYFPLTFRAQPAASQGFSVAELTATLRAVLTEPPAFAPMTIAFLVEKLDIPTAPAATKVETLVTLAAALRAASAATLRARASEVWAALRATITAASSEDVAAEVLRTVFALVAAAAAAGRSASGEPSDDPSAATATLTAVIAPILADVHRTLIHPDTKDSRVLTEVLVTTAQGAPAACAHVLDATLPPLLLSLEDPAVNRGPATLGLLTVLVGLVRAAEQTATRIALADRVLAALMEGLASLSPTARASCFAGLAAMRAYLSADTRERALEAVRLALCGDRDEVVRLAARAVLGTVLAPLALDPDAEATASGRDATALVTRVLFAPIAERLDTAEDQAALGCLCEIAAVKPELAPRVHATLLGALAARLARAPDAQRESALVRVLTALLRTVDEPSAGADESDAPPAQVVRAWAELFGALAAPAAAGALGSETSGPMRVAEELLVRAVARLPSSAQVELVASPALASELARAGEAPTNMALMRLVTAALGGLTPAVFVAVPGIDAFGARTLAAMIAAPNAVLGAALAVYANRAASGSSAVLAVVTAACDAATDGATGAALTPALAPWLIRGLAPRRAAETQALTRALVGSLERDEPTARAAAAAIGLILEPDWLFLEPKRCHPVVWRLWRQQLFSAMVTPCLEAYDAAHARCAAGVQPTAHLAAIVELARSVPHAALVAYLPKVLPLLARSLHCADVALRGAAVDVFIALCTQDASKMVAHVDPLVASLCDLCSEPAVPPERYAAAIRALFVLGSVNRAVCAPHKKRVLVALAARLDDPMRAIRKLAVATANRWHIL